MTAMRHRCTHPNEHVVVKVPGVTELPSQSSELDDGILDLETLDSCLSMFQRFANAHHCWTVMVSMSSRGQIIGYLGAIDSGYEFRPAAMQGRTYICGTSPRLT